MTVLSFEEAMGQIDDEIILEAVSALNSENRSVDFIKHRQIRRTLLVAAVIAALLTAAAFAIGYSIHQKRQAELRQQLQIDSSNVTSYVEYAAPETAGRGVTILSAICDGKFQKLYVNISPVEREEVESINKTSPFLFFWSIDGKAWTGVEPLPDGYDEQSKTLTVECSILMKLLAGKDSAQLQIAKIDWDKFEGSDSPENWLEENNALLGTACFTPTEQEMRYITFTPVVFTDEDTGREVTVLALELSPTGAVWHLCYDGAEKLYDPGRHNDVLDESSLELLRAEDYVLGHAVLHFADGTSFSPGGALSGSFVDGVVLPYVGWERAIDINAVESITIGDTVLPMN